MARHVARPLSRAIVTATAAPGTHVCIAFRTVTTASYPHITVDPSVVADIVELNKTNHFVHVTPATNTASIEAEGITLRTSGGSTGLSGTDRFSAHKAESKGHVFFSAAPGRLSKTIQAMLPKSTQWIPTPLLFLLSISPSLSYKLIFSEMGIASDTIDVMVPRHAPSDPSQAKLEAMKLSCTGLFRPPQGVIKLIEQGQLSRDWGDLLPGRYKTDVAIPADHITSFEKLKNQYNDGTLDLDTISDSLLNTLTKHPKLNTASREEKIVHLKAAFNEGHHTHAATPG